MTTSFRSDLIFLQSLADIAKEPKTLESLKEGLLSLGGLGTGSLTVVRTGEASNGYIPVLVNPLLIFSTLKALSYVGKNRRKKSCFIILHRPWLLKMN